MMERTQEERDHICTRMVGCVVAFVSGGNARASALLVEAAVLFRLGSEVGMGG